MRKYFIAGNWKMHKTKSEAVALAGAVVKAVKDGKHKYMIAPSFTALDAVAQVVNGTNVLLGAQNMSITIEGYRCAGCDLGAFGAPAYLWGNRCDDQ